MSVRRARSIAFDVPPRSFVGSPLKQWAGSRTTARPTAQTVSFHRRLFGSDNALVHALVRIVVVVEALVGRDRICSM